MGWARWRELRLLGLGLLAAALVLGAPLAHRNGQAAHDLVAKTIVVAKEWLSTKQEELQRRTWPPCW